MAPSISSVTYGNVKIQSKDVLTSLASAISNKTKITINRENLGTTTSTSEVKTCSIEYQTGDGQVKRRSLEEGQTFDFANDINILKYNKLIDDPSAFEKIFKQMDTSDSFLVETPVFGRGVKLGGTHTCEMVYTLPDGTTRQQMVKEGNTFFFKKGKIVDPIKTDPDPGTTNPEPTKPEPKEPEPSKPAPKEPEPTKPEPTKPVPTNPGTTNPLCPCPCPSCAANHKTPEQKKAAEEQKAKEEAERQEQIEALKKVVDEAKRTAEEAGRQAESTRKDLEEARKDAQEAKHGLEEAKKELAEAKKGLEEAKKDMEEAKKEITEANKGLEEVKKDMEEVKGGLNEARKDAREAKQASEEAKRDSAQAKKGSEQAKKEAEQLWQEIDDVRRVIGKGARRTEVSTVVFRTCAIGSQFLALVVLVSYVFDKFHDKN